MTPAAWGSLVRSFTLVDRPAGLGAEGVVGGKSREGQGAHPSQEGIPTRQPELVEFARVLVRAFRETHHAVIPPLGSVHGLGQIEQRYLPGRAGQHDAALLAALGDDQALLGQPSHELGKVGRRDPRALGHHLDKVGLAPRFLQTGESLDGKPVERERGKRGFIGVA